MTRKFSEIKTGSSGTDVIVLQSFLRSMHFVDNTGKRIEVDGDYGSRTAYAVRNFQQFCKACGQDVGTPDGVCGAKTWRLIMGE